MKTAAGTMARHAKRVMVGSGNFQSHGITCRCTFDEAVSALTKAAKDELKHLLGVSKCHCSFP